MLSFMTLPEEACQSSLIEITEKLVHYEAWEKSNSGEQNYHKQKLVQELQVFVQQQWHSQMQDFQ